MKVPIKPLSFKKSELNYKWIVIHDTTCSPVYGPKFVQDTRKSQIQNFRELYFSATSEYDLNYHYIIDIMADMPEVVLGRPLVYQCNFDGTKEEYKHAIHICMMGSKSVEIPSQMVYQKISYSILIPMMSMFRLSFDSIKMHYEIVEENVMQTHRECPGLFFDKNVLLATLKTMMYGKTSMRR